VHDHPPVSPHLWFKFFDQEFISLTGMVEQNPLEKTACPEQVFKSGADSEKRYE
jgi:hypothetical protein